MSDKHKLSEHGAFLSYARRDEAYPDEPLTFLRDSLQSEISRTLGREFKIWMDRSNIVPSQRWKQAIYDGLCNARVLIAIVTPSWLNSENCREEFEVFRNHDLALSDTSIFPIYLRNDDRISNSIDKSDPAYSVTQELQKIQYADWRGIRSKIENKQLSNSSVKKKIDSLVFLISRQLLEINAPAKLNTSDQKLGPMVQRIINPIGKITRDHGPARLEIWSGQNQISLDQLNLSVECRFRMTEVRAKSYTFSLGMIRAKLQVDVWGCSIDYNSCIGRTDHKFPNIKYELQGEWKIERVDGSILEGDPLPKENLCTLINCAPDCGAEIAIVGEEGDFFVDSDNIKDDRLIPVSWTTTSRRLIALWAAERPHSKENREPNDIVVSEATFRTTIKND